MRGSMDFSLINTWVLKSWFATVMLLRLLIHGLARIQHGKPILFDHI